MNEQNPKKAYARPRLVVYGDIRALTLTNQSASKVNDGQGSGQTKT